MATLQELKAEYARCESLIKYYGIFNNEAQAEEKIKKYEDLRAFLGAIICATK